MFVYRKTAAIVSLPPECNFLFLFLFPETQKSLLDEEASCGCHFLHCFL